MINVLIADDHHLVRQGIRALLEQDQGIRVVAEAENGPQALSKVIWSTPDVALLDIHMPEMDGIEVTRRVSEKLLPTHVLILSMYSDLSIVVKAFRAGAHGYLLKKSVAGDLLEGIRAVYHHQLYITPALNIRIEHVLDLLPQIEETNATRLTNRELEVCQLITSGMTNSAIAQQLHISVKTVEKHRSNLMRKLGVQDVVGLVREALSRGIVFLER